MGTDQIHRQLYSMFYSDLNRKEVKKEGVGTYIQLIHFAA